MFFNKYYSLLKEHGRLSLVKIILMGLIGGTSGTLLIVIINNVVALDPHNQKFFPKFFAGFIAVMGVHFMVQRVYQASLVKLSMNLVWKIRLEALDRIRKSDFQKYHLFGPGKVYNILTSDAVNIGRIGQMLSVLIVSAVTIVSCLVYLLFLTPVGFCVSLAVMILVAGMHSLSENQNRKLIMKAVVAEDDFFRYFGHILYGLKELKHSQKMSDDLFTNYTEKAGNEARDLRLQVNIRFLNNSLVSQFFFFGIIALFLFVFPFFHISLLSNSSQYILLILYMIGPAQLVGQFVPDFLQASIGLDRFNELKQLAEIKEAAAGPDAGFPATRLALSFNNVLFQYQPGADEEGFFIGPLNFQLRQGEIVFLSGGNGSGKSTLIKLLTGIYLPTAGTVSVDDKIITAGNIQLYRHLFSVVYTDNYLFDRIYGAESNLDADMAVILRTLSLQNKVTFTDHAFSTIDLSYGQKKRLSLASSLLENKQIYVFDELAANQDFEFKEYFYKTILFDLRNKGKTVFVVTHDEKYFHVADKHYKMEEGRLTKIQK